MTAAFWSTQLAALGSIPPIEVTQLAALGSISPIEVTQILALKFAPLACQISLPLIPLMPLTLIPQMGSERDSDWSNGFIFSGTFEAATFRTSSTGSSKRAPSLIA